MRTLRCPRDTLSVTPYARSMPVNEKPGRSREPEPEHQPTADPVSGRSSLSGVASSIAGAAGPALSASLAPLGNLASGARRRINERSGARVRRVRRMGHQPLTNLWELYPEGQRGSMREQGLRSVPVVEIAGTAVQGAAQRGGDFLPLRDRRSDDWRARWQRILSALDRLESLPPVELVRFAGRYWVVDGHNRVAAALYNGPFEIDAEVDDLRLPGHASRPATPIASVLEGSQDLRDAGAGRLSRTADRPLDLQSARPHEHEPEQGE